MVFLEIPNVPKGTVFAEQVTYINNSLNTTYFLHLLHMYISCPESKIPVAIEPVQLVLLKLFLMICANIKAMLCDTEDSIFKPLIQNTCPSTPVYTFIELLIATG